MLQEYLNSCLRANFSKEKHPKKKIRLKKESQEHDACLGITESESIMCSLQTDMQLLHKQHSSHKNDLKKKDAIIMNQRKDLKILESKKK